jgi:putative hydrolase of the HAD superfamily
MIDAGTRAVFFDAVGTLLFPHPPVAAVYAEFANRHGAACTAEQVRGPMRAAFTRQEEFDHATGWRTDEARERARWRTVVRESLPAADPEPCFVGLWEWFASPRAWTVHSQAGEVIRSLADGGLVVGIASNFDERLRPLVTAFPELVPLADRCVISSAVGWRKPAREFFAEVARVAGCKPGQVLYVGDDRRNDYDGATAAGLRAVLFDPESRMNEAHVIRNLRDILAG